MVVKLILDSIQESFKEAAKTNAGIWLGRVVTSLQANALPITIAVMALAATIFCYNCFCNHAKNGKKTDNLNKPKIPTPTNVPLPKPIIPIPQPILIEEKKSAVKVRTIDDIISGVTDETLEGDIAIVYEYLKDKRCPSADELNKCSSIPLNILEKLDVSKFFSDDPLYWLCFGETKESHIKYYSISAPLKRVTIQQARFEALAGTDDHQLQSYFQNENLRSCFSINQLKTIRASPNFESNLKKICRENEIQFFPGAREINENEIVKDIEQKRFAALFNVHDVQFMLEDGVLSFKTGFFAISKFSKVEYPEEYHISIYCMRYTTWFHHLSIIPLDYIQQLDFSCKEEEFRIHPAQITLMFGPSELNWSMEKLSIKQKNDILNALKMFIKSDDPANKFFLNIYRTSVTFIIEQLHAHTTLASK